MRILITGSEGNIGSKLVPYLRTLGHEVFRIDMLQKYAKDYTMANVVNPTDMYETFVSFKPEVVVHLAAMVSRITCEKSSGLTIDTNISGVNNVINLCRVFKSKMIYFSTSEIYGNIGGILSEDRKDICPNNRYGLSKFIGEKLVEYEVKNYGLNAISVRPFMFYDEDETFGENRSAMIRFAENLVREKRVEVHEGSQRSWMHISDAVQAIERTFYVQTYEAINLGHPTVVDMEYVAQHMCSILGIDPSEHVCMLPFPDKMTQTKYPDLTKQTILLKFTPKVELKDGIERVVKKVKERLS